MTKIAISLPRKSHEFRKKILNAGIKRQDMIQTLRLEKKRISGPKEIHVPHK